MNAILPLALLFLVCDIPWIWLISGHAQTMYKEIQGTPIKFRLEGAIPVYLALAYLIQKVSSMTEAFFMGLAVYTIYEFTTYTILAKYDLSFAIADSLWGGILFVLVRSIALRLNIL